MIIDNFLFFNEYDMLEFRLETLYNSVDKFVIVEGNHTFTNNPKPYNLENNWDRYAKWKDKIEYIKVGKGPGGANTWVNEHWHRSKFKRAWNNLNSKDVVIISDCDEIIRPEAIDFIKNTDYTFYGLYMPAFYFKYNYLDTKKDWHYKIWSRAYRGFQTDPGKMRNLQAHEIRGSTISLHHAGWHFGWIGDNNFVKNKIQSFSHTEFNVPEILNTLDIDRNIIEGTDHLRPQNKTWKIVDIDDYFPHHLRKNLDKYGNFILPNTGKKVLDFFDYKILEET